MILVFVAVERRAFFHTYKLKMQDRPGLTRTDKGTLNASDLVAQRDLHDKRRGMRATMQERGIWREVTIDKTNAPPGEGILRVRTTVDTPPPKRAVTFAQMQTTTPDTRPTNRPNGCANWCAIGLALLILLVIIVFSAKKCMQ